MVCFIKKVGVMRPSKNQFLHRQWNLAAHGGVEGCQQSVKHKGIKHVYDNSLNKSSQTFSAG